MDLTDLMHEILDNYPDKCVVNVSDYENQEHETYKHLYENLSERNKKSENENLLLLSEVHRLQEKLQEADELIHTLEDQVSSLNDSAASDLDILKDLCDKEIFVTNIKTAPVNEDGDIFDYESLAKTISEHPGVYGNYRPSWFSPLQTELSKSNVTKKNVKNTTGSFLKILQFWKQFGNKISTNPDVVADAFDQERKKNILELLQSDCSNEEKYLKYFMMTPGLDKEFLKTLDGAAELNINAKLIISLLEQPENKYNREVIESYVSRLHKGTEYNLKQELAEELVNGKWYISANVGKGLEKFRLVPESLIDQLFAKLDALNNEIDISADKEPSAKLAEGSLNDIQIENQDHSVSENEIEIPEMEYPEMPSFVSFDDSMLNDGQ